jgi:hypothetical protein
MCLEHITKNNVQIFLSGDQSKGKCPSKKKSSLTESNSHKIKERRDEEQG